MIWILHIIENWKKLGGPWPPGSAYVCVHARACVFIQGLTLSILGVYIIQVEGFLKSNPTRWIEKKSQLNPTHYRFGLKNWKLFFYFKKKKNSSKITTISTK